MTSKSTNSCGSNFSLARDREMISDPIHLLSIDHECLIPEKPSGVDRLTAESLHTVCAYCTWIKRWALYYHSTYTLTTVVVSIDALGILLPLRVVQRKDITPLSTNSIRMYGLFIFASFDRCQTISTYTTGYSRRKKFPILFTTEFYSLTATRAAHNPVGRVHDEIKVESKWSSNESATTDSHRTILLNRPVEIITLL